MLHTGYAEPAEDWTGTVGMVGGLYRLKMLPLGDCKEHKSSFTTDFIPPNVSAFSCNRMSIDLWHFRLGHPSFERFWLLKEKYSLLNSDKQFVCDTCHFSK